MKAILHILFGTSFLSICAAMAQPAHKQTRCPPFNNRLPDNTTSNPMRKLVTFDFDDTLTLPIKDNEGHWVSGGSVPNEKTIAAMKDIAARGHEVAIVTSRICTDSSKQRIATFVMKHELPVEREVVFTNKEWKADFLEKIGSVLHFDDSKEELERIEAKGIQAVEVHHPPGPRRLPPIASD